MPGILNQLVIFDKGTEVSDILSSYTITAHRQFDRELPANSTCCSMSTNHTRHQWVCTDEVWPEKQSQRKADFILYADFEVLFFSQSAKSSSQFMQKDYHIYKKVYINKWISCCHCDYC